MAVNIAAHVECGNLMNYLNVRGFLSRRCFRIVTRGEVSHAPCCARKKWLRADPYNAFEVQRMKHMTETQ